MHLWLFLWNHKWMKWFVAKTELLMHQSNVIIYITAWVYVWNAFTHSCCSVMLWSRLCNPLIQLAFLYSVGQFPTVSSIYGLHCSRYNFPSNLCVYVVIISWLLYFGFCHLCCYRPQVVHAVLTNTALELSRLYVSTSFEVRIDFIKPFKQSFI